MIPVVAALIVASTMALPRRRKRIPSTMTWESN
jgi:hypothetical protein